jgi:MFS transporter, YNFM family, putative membrane transport protein
MPPTKARRALADAQPARVVGQPRRALVDAEPTQVVAPLAILVPCALLVLMQLYLAIPLAPVVGEALASGGAAVALGTTYSLAYALGLLIFGPLSDRYGRKPVLIPGMVALAIGTAVLSLASSMTMVGVLRAVQGLLAASFAAVTLAYVGEALPRRWRSTGIGAVATAFLVAGIVGQVYAQAVADALGWRWVFGLAAPAFALAAVGLGTILVEPVLRPSPASLGQEYRELATLARRRQLALPYLALVTILLSFVAMYAALGPWLATRFGLDNAEILLVRLAGLPGMVLAPLAGWLVGRFGATRVCVAGFGMAAVGLTLEAVTAGTLWALVAASAVFVAGIATVVPAMITLVGSRAGPARGGALGLGGLALFAGASFGPLAPDLPLGFSRLLLALAVLLLVGAALVALSSRPTGESRMA